MPRPAVMLRQVARLTPFERSIPSDIQVSALLVWNSNGWLELSYGLLALAPPGLSTLVLPSPLNDGSQQGKRRDGLWTATCFEAFLALPNQSRYWEINLSPNGDWAVYSFESYRTGQQPQMLKQDPEMGIQRLHHHLRVDVRLPLAPWWSAGVCPEVNLSAVIDHGEAGLSHWAHRHQAKADFHDRSTFLKG